MSDFRHLIQCRARLSGSRFCRITVSTLLVAVCVNVNGPLDASNGGLAPCLQAHPKLEQRSDEALSQCQQSEQGTSPTNAPKPVLTDGTAIRLKFVRGVVSSRVIAGEKVPLEVVESVLAGKLVAIPQHSAEEAIVTMAQADRSMGRGGRLQFKIENIRLADGELVPVRAMKDVKGGGNRAAALTGEAGMAAGFAFWPASPLTFLVYVRGKNAKIPAGAEITAYIAGDFPLDPSKFQEVDTSLRQKDVSK